MFRRFAPLTLLVVCLACAATGTHADEAGTAIFDGASLAGWEGKPGLWRVEDGAIVGETTAENPIKSNTFLIWKQGLVDDFELTLRYRLTGTERANSGIQYRSRDRGDFVVSGYQADFEAGRNHSGILYEEKGRGILCKRGQRTTVAADGTKVAGEPIGDATELQEAIKPGNWNDYRIVARGPTLQHFINGQLMAEVVDEQAEKRSLEGILALQLHVGPPMKVEFKDIRLQRMQRDDDP